MKKMFLGFVSTLVVCTFFYACKKVDEIKVADMVLTVKPISKTQLLEIENRIKPYLDLKNRGMLINTYSTESTAGNDSLSSAEIAIRNELVPLIENGQQVYDELVSQLQQQPEWETLSESEKQDILNINSETQFVDLSLQYSSMGIANGPITSDKFISCLSAVVGVYYIRDTISGIITWPAAMKLTKFLLRRYSSWIGLGLTIYDMAECLNN
jgi:hypothetical protein